MLTRADEGRLANHRQCFSWIVPTLSKPVAFWLPLLKLRSCHTKGLVRSRLGLLFALVVGVLTGDVVHHGKNYQRTLQSVVAWENDSGSNPVESFAPDFNVRNTFEGTRQQYCFRTFVHRNLSASVSSTYRSASMKEGKFYGRLGNRLTAVKNMISTAEAEGCNFVIPGEILSGWRTEKQYFMHTSIASFESNFSTQCLPMASSQWYYLSTPSPPKCYNHLMRQYFDINKTHTLGHRCKSSAFVAFHVRSGDVAEGEFNKTSGDFVPSTHAHIEEYGLFPTSYYLSVISEVRSRRGRGYQVIVFCEDLGNPTCIFFRKLAHLEANVEIRIGQPLIDDLHLMLCAEEVATSRGTFSQVFELSVKRQRTHAYFDSSSQVPCSKASATQQNEIWKSDKVAHWILSPTESSAFRNATRRWKNTSYQRDAVDKYFITSHCYLH